MSAHHDIQLDGSIPASVADILAYHPGLEAAPTSPRRDAVRARETDPAWQAFAYWEPA